MDTFKDQQLTFKVEVKRTDKTFPLDSHSIQREIGGEVFYHNIKTYQ
ncbi:putative tRNA sulfurtransferase OS=Lysinibacillus sphaericus OX=1421 GN=thiI PE=3 SV=1 [Lysinibacillus sphaericus]